MGQTTVRTHPQRYNLFLINQQVFTKKAKFIYGILCSSHRQVPCIGPLLQDSGRELHCCN